MTFIPVAGQNCDIVLELPDGTKMGFLCARDSALRMQRASDYAPIVAEAGTETEATGAWRRWKQTDFSGGLGEENWDSASMVNYSEGLEFHQGFVSLASAENKTHDTLALHHFVDFGGDIYACAGSDIYKYDIATSTWSASVQTMGAAITDLVVIDDAMFCMCGVGNNGYYSTDGAAWVDMGEDGTHLIWAFNLAWLSDGNSIKSIATPKAGAWSADEPVGDAAYDITSLCAYNQLLYIGKEEGLFAYDGSTTPIPMVKDVSYRTYANNFKNMVAWQGYLYFAVMSTIYKFHASSENVITPRYIGTKDKEFYGFGLPVDFLPSQDGLYVLFDNAAGTHRALLRYTGLGWYRVDTGTSDTSTPSGLGWSRQKNWLLLGTNSDTFYYLRRAYTDRPADDYAETGYFITPWFDGGFPDEQMEIRVMALEMDDASSTEKATVYYETDRSGSWTTLGVYSSDREQLSFSELAGAISCREIRFKIVLARDSGDATVTPRLRSWAMQFKNRPRVIHIYTPQLRLGDELPDLNKEDRFEDTLADQIAFLRRCEEATTPLTYHTDQFSRLVDLTNLQRTSWGTIGDEKTRHEPTVVLNLIDAFAGDVLTVEEEIAFSNSVTLTTHGYTEDVHWANDVGADTGLGQPERQWGQFTYED